MGYYKKDCRSKKSNGQGNKDENKEKFVAMISEVNFLKGEDAWWIDSGATKHVCKDRSSFLTYAPVEDGNVLYMGNSSTAEVKGKGKVELEFTSGKILTLTDVYHVPDVRKNLVSGSLLNENGFKLVFESNKFILSKGGTFVGKGYMYEGMFKMNINKVNVYVYKLDSISLWHNRLGHVNIRKMHDRVKLELIPKDDENLVDKFFLVEGSRDKVSTSTMIDLKIEPDPKTHEEAIKYQDAAFWKEAINDEMDSIMDDMLIFGSDMDTITRTKEFLSLNFDMKDMGVADVILGSLMYAMTCTRPDIAFAVGKLSRFTSNPSNVHWNAINRILKYLKGIIDYGLSYSGYPVVLEGFTDASWLTERVDHSSTSGWIFTLGGGAISWASKKQTCITTSTMEAEFIALASCCKEAEWLRNLLIEIPIWPKPMPSIYVHCDSHATLSRAYNHVYNGKSRHIGLRHSIIRQLLTDGVVTIDYVRSSQNLADPLTKGLARDMVLKTSMGMGQKPITNDHQ
ncbi:uncharacterized protein LOC143888156 [Tasmannia lanceolata]|uniref:uncharacterized protein LOC143888156 n=1 Tax=Tasmannia lanceolata TaxID=3420 RepID=UPI004063B530